MSSIGHHIEKVDDTFIHPPHPFSSCEDIFVVTLVIILVWNLDVVDINVLFTFSIITNITHNLRIIADIAVNILPPMPPQISISIDRSSIAIQLRESSLR